MRRSQINLSLFKTNSTQLTYTKEIVTKAHCSSACIFYITIIEIKFNTAIATIYFSNCSIRGQFLNPLHGDKMLFKFRNKTVRNRSLVKGHFTDILVIQFTLICVISDSILVNTQYFLLTKPRTALSPEGRMRQQTRQGT